MNWKPLIEIASPIATILVAIMGFCINLKLNKLNAKNEIRKYKTNKQLDKLQEAIIELLECINLITQRNVILFESQIKNRQIQRNTELFNKLMNVINLVTGYGSIDSVKIAGHLYQMLHRKSREFKEQTEKIYMEREDRAEIIAYLTLLMCQLKFEVTNVIMEPDLYYRCKINYNLDTSYEYHEFLVNANNKVVDELNLNKLFRIEEVDEVS